MTFGRLPCLMGIVNVTPDSFFDGGRFLATSAAIDQALLLADQGADLLDIGGESTRPYATPVTAEEELRRVLPVVTAVCRQVTIPVSIDTSKATVARACIAAGAEIINDITGLDGDPEMVEVARDSGAGVCVMHMQGSPQTMQDAPAYQDVVGEVAGYLMRRRDALVSAGLEQGRICLDPGIGFGKTVWHNLQLMVNCHAFHTLGQPLLVGHSHKGFLAKIMKPQTADRTFVTAGAAVALATQGIQILRVHDIPAVQQTLLGFAAAGGLEKCDTTTPP